jgi:chaperonin GroEL
MVLTTEAIVVDKPEPKTNTPASSGSGMSDYDY